MVAASFWQLGGPIGDFADPRCEPMSAAAFCAAALGFRTRAGGARRGGCRTLRHLLRHPELLRRIARRAAPFLTSSSAERDPRRL